MGDIMDDILKLRSEYEKLQEENEHLKKEKQVLEDTLYSKDKNIENLRSDVLQLNEINKRVSTRLDTISALVDIIQLINKDKSLNLPLTALAGYLQASSCHILKQRKDKTYTFLNSSINYFYPDNVEKFQSSTINYMDLFTILSSQFSENHSPMLIDLTEDFIKNYSVLVKNDIKRITLTNITDEDDNYLLVVINANILNDCNLLELVRDSFKASLERNRLAITDKFTNLYNRDYYQVVINSLQVNPPRSVTYIMIDLFRLKFINDNYGHAAGDYYIKLAAKILKKIFNDDYVFHFGGDEFGIIIPNKDLEDTKIKMDNAATIFEQYRIRSSIEQFPKKMNYGIAYAENVIDLESLSKEADRLMEEDKRRYYQENNFARRI